MIPSVPAKPRRILLVSLDNLGDLVFASALTPPLHAAFPDATIDVWSKSYTAPIARLMPHVGHVVHADPFWAATPGREPSRIGPMVRAIADIRRRAYDVAILSTAPWRSAAAVAATRIPIRIGLARHRNRLFLTHVLPPEDRHQPVVHEQARLLAPLGVTIDHPRYALDVERLAGARATISAELPRSFIALHPFAGAPDRCVPLTEWTQLARALDGRGVPVLWIGTTQDLDEFRRSLPDPLGYYVDRIGDGSLTVTAAALSLASAFAGHDSGPLHVAGACGVPVVGVFAPGEPDRTFPQGTGPSRMITAPNPAAIHAADILRELDALQILSAT
jgi:ADP-heptose:LPS heptosyltransferase